MPKIKAKTTPNQKPKTFITFTPAFVGPNDVQLRKNRARDEGRNFDETQSFDNVAKILLESGHYDESGFSLADALSLRGELSDAECREEFAKFVKELMAKDVVKEIHGCMNYPQYQFRLFGYTRRILETDKTSSADTRPR